MSLKPALLAAATASALLLLPSCGGEAPRPLARYAVIDLHSNAYTTTYGYSIGDGEQVGGDLHGHSLLWRGSASSVVELQLPAGFAFGGAGATSGGSQVRSGSLPGRRGHAR